MIENFQSNLHASRLENLLKLATNADTVLNSPLKVLTNDILWKSFERYQTENNLNYDAKYVGNQIGIKIKKWMDPHTHSNNSQSNTNDLDYLQQDIAILHTNLVKVSKKIQSMNNKDLLDVIKTNHLHGIKYALNHILNPIIQPRKQIRAITPPPYKAITHSIPPDHSV